MCKFNDVIAVSNRTLCSRPFLEQLERVCKLQPRAIVLREKDMPETEYLSLASDVLTLCKKYNVMCILHSFVNVAIELNHPYIHLPLPLLEQYKLSTQTSSGSEYYQHFFKETGTSVHSVDDAVKAAQLGATYVTAGHIFATNCKMNLPPRGLDFLQNVCNSVNIPVYAIGGINICNDNDSFNIPRLNDVMCHGASGACIMSGMMKI